MHNSKAKQILEQFKATEQSNIKNASLYCFGVSWDIGIDISFKKPIKINNYWIDRIKGTEVLRLNLYLKDEFILKSPIDELL